MDQSPRIKLGPITRSPPPIVVWRPSPLQLLMRRVRRWLGGR